MAKKFGKFLLVTAAVCTAAAAIHHYMQKKDAASTESEDEDYDDFSVDSHNYVSLTPDAGADQKETSGNESASKEEGFTPLKDAVENATEKAEDAIENVEEFFDEEDGSDEEPAISDN